MSTKQGRDQLKTYFETGDRPTEDEFSEFIDSGINQVDDTVHIAEVDGKKYMGVGRVDPTARLDVDGNINVSGHIFGRKAGMTDEDFLIVSNSAEIQLFGKNHPNRKGDLFLIGDKSENGLGKISFDQRITANQWRSNMLIDTNRNVGIGTNLTSAGNKLEIAVSSGNNTGLKLTHGAGLDKLLVSDANGNARWEQPTNLTNGFWTKNGNHIGNTNAGNVGVAATNPIGKFQIDDDITRVAIGSTYQLNSNGSSNTGYGTGYIGFNAARANGTWNLVSDGGNNGGALMYSDVGGSINLATFPSSGPGNQNITDTDMLTSHIRMKIDGTGNVGIGTRSPASKLDVRGNISINDNSLYLRGGTDKYHGVQYNAQTDGPHLFGNSGGALTTKSPGNNGPVEKTAMQWFANQSVDFKGDIKVNGAAPFLIERFQFKELSGGVRLNRFNTTYGAAVVIGFNTTATKLPHPFPEKPDFKIAAYTYLVGNEWYVKADVESANDHELWQITIMYIVKEMVSWNTTQITNYP
jgi:hypothetical protein